MLQKRADKGREGEEKMTGKVYLSNEFICYTII
jgi:hypothetical protein